MGIDHSKTINDEVFWDWLKPRVTPRQLSEMYRYAHSLNSYYVPQYRFDISILNEMARSSAKRVREAITLDKSYRKKYSQYDRQFISSLLDYMEFFLKEQNSSVSSENDQSVDNNPLTFSVEDKEHFESSDSESKNISVSENSSEKISLDNDDKHHFSEINEDVSDKKYSPQNLITRKAFREFLETQSIKEKKRIVYFETLENLISSFQLELYETDIDSSYIRLDELNRRLLRSGFSENKNIALLLFRSFLNSLANLEVNPFIRSDEPFEIVNFDNISDLNNTTPCSLQFYEDKKTNIASWRFLYNIFLEIFYLKYPGFFRNGMKLNPDSKSPDVYYKNQTDKLVSYSQFPGSKLVINDSGTPNTFICKIKFMLDAKQIPYDEVIITYQPLNATTTTPEIISGNNIQEDTEAENANQEIVSEVQEFVPNYSTQLDSIEENIQKCNEQVPISERKDVDNSEQKEKDNFDSPAAQPRWTMQEAAVLLDAYLKVQEHPEKRKVLVQQVSDQLRQMAINQGMQISEKYRNYNGICFQMSSMETAWTGRSPVGHAHSSSVFAEIVRLFREERSTYYNLLKESQRLCKGTEIQNISVIITKKDFQEFLAKKGIDTHQRPSIWASIFDMQQKCNIVLFDRTLEECMEITKQLEQKLSNPVFFTSGRNQAVSLLMEFLSEISLNKNGRESTPENIISFIDTLQDNTTEYLDEGRQEQKDDKTSSSIIDEDEEWIITEIKNRGLIYKDNRLLSGALWILGGHELDDFVDVCRAHGYTMWYKTDGGRTFAWQPRWWTNDIIYNQFILENSKPVDVLSSKDNRWLPILQESFVDGYILDDFVSQFQAAAYWQERYGEDCPIDGAQIDKELKSIGTVIDGRVYAKKDDNNTLIEEICAEINNILSIYTCVYRSCIYERYSKRLAAQSIYTETVMTQQLLNTAKGSFYSTNKIFARPGQEASSLQDGHKVLRDHGGAMSVSDISEELWFIPYDRVYHNLSVDSEAINVGTGTWMLAEHFPLTADDAIKISEMLDDCFQTQDNVKKSEITPLLKENLPFIAENLSGLDNNAIFNILYYHLKDRFSFTKAIISPKGAKKDFMDIFRGYAKDHDRFSLDELSAFAKSQNTGIYWEDTFIGGAVRINRTEFVNKRMFTFDVEATDKILENLCPGDYISLHDIPSAMMMHFPSCGYSWNGYLLQSYLFCFSKKYKLVYKSFSKTGYYGAIVKLSSKINWYDQLVEKVLTDDRSWKNSDEAISLLVREGYQERHRLDSIDKIISRIP